MRQETILTIDDDELVRSAYARILEQGGFRVIQAEDGHSGMANFREHHPDAVLLDLRMPGLDGLEVLEALVAHAPETPVVISSGTERIADVVQALRRGAWDYVTKPIEDPVLLRRAMERALEKSRLLRENREYADRLASALEELRADELAARRLQFQLLPEDGLSAGDVRCHRRLFPSHLLSGDFVDYFFFGDRLLGFYLADVAGHGSASALVTVILTTLVGKYRDAYAARGDDTIRRPSQLLTQLDADLAGYRLDRHITMFYGVLDCASGELVYGNAGAFPYPFLREPGADGPPRPGDVRQLECSGRPLNLAGRAGFGSGETRLEPGGRLLIASDGVLELGATGTHRERCRRLADLARDASGIDEFTSALQLDDTTTLKDDVALLLIERGSP